jgi:hypothetical protein
MQAAETGELDIEELIKFDEKLVSNEKMAGEKFVSAVDAELAETDEEVEKERDDEEETSEDDDEDEDKEDCMLL